jgi:hypothetical protein
VYPPQEDGEPWRAVFVENGRRRFREAVTEEKLAAKLEKVTERLARHLGTRIRPAGGPRRSTSSHQPARLKAGIIGGMLQTGAPLDQLSVRELLTMVASLYPRPLKVEGVLRLTGGLGVGRSSDEQAAGRPDVASPLRGRPRRERGPPRAR